MAESPMKTGLLSSIDAVFELNKREADKKVEALRIQRQRELAHSQYLKSKASSSGLQAAKFVVGQWTKINSSRRIDAISRKAELKRNKRKLSGHLQHIRKNNTVPLCSPLNPTFSNKMTSQSSTAQSTSIGSSSSTFNKKRKSVDSDDDMLVLEDESKENIETGNIRKKICVDSPSDRRQLSPSVVAITDDEKCSSVIDISDDSLDSSDLILLSDVVSQKASSSRSDVKASSSRSDIKASSSRSDVKASSSRSDVKASSSRSDVKASSSRSDVKASSSRSDVKASSSRSDVKVLSDSKTSQKDASIYEAKKNEGRSIYQATKNSSSSLATDFVSCPILNCNFKTKSRFLFDQHMDQFVHSPLNPWIETPAPRLSKEDADSMCPKCFKIFKTKEACIQHCRSVCHPKYPVPVSAYLCHYCLKLFPSKELCSQHAQKENHKSVTFPFKDDMGDYTNGVPVSLKFVTDYVKVCMETKVTVECSDCGLEMNGAQQIKQHLNETRLLHHCMALTDLSQTEVFTKYLCMNQCLQCLAVVYDPKANGAVHSCSKTSCGTVIIDGVKSFKALLTGHCIRLEQEKSSENYLQYHPDIEVLEPEDRISDCIVESRTREDTVLQCQRKTAKTTKKFGKKPANVKTVSTSSSLKTGQNGSQKDMVQNNPPYHKFSNGTEPDPESLKHLTNIIFLDIDNWSKFFYKLPRRLPEKTFVWGFYGGKTHWIPPMGVDAFDHQVRENLFYLHERCGSTKDAADFAIALTIGKMDMCLPPNVHFTILSGDKGFCELERQFKNSSKRKAVVIDPHDANKFSYDALYTMIVSVSEI